MKTCPKCDNTWADSHAYCPRDGTVLTVQEELAPGTIFRRKFRILSEIGHGGMGVVYKVEHVLLKQERAMKLINARYASDPQAVRRFLSEASLANQIDHPNVVGVYDAEETDEGQPYIIMEYVQGSSLRQVMTSGEGGKLAPLPAIRAIGIAAQVCAGLAAAHEKRIIHRDIKPDNILVCPNADGSDVVKVVDFGLAKAKTELADTKLSVTGMFLGTPNYCSPEQALGTGDTLDHRTDIYSLGVVLYEMLVGQLPYAGAYAEVMQQKNTVPTPAPQIVRPDLKIPEELANIALKALKREPRDRFDSADQMRIALENVRDAMPGAPPRGIESQRTRSATVTFDHSGPTIQQAPVPQVTAQEKSLPPKVDRGRRWLIPAALGILVVAAIVVAVFFMGGSPVDSPKVESSTGPVAAEAASQCETLINDGEHVAAVGALESVLRTDPQNAGARQCLNRAADHVKALMDTGDYDGSIRLLGAILRVDPQHARALTLMSNSKTAKASLLIVDGKNSEAVTLLEEVLHADPKNSQARSLLESAKGK